MTWLTLVVGVVAFLAGWILHSRRKTASPVATHQPPTRDNIQALDQALEGVRAGLRAGRTMVWHVPPNGERAQPWLVRGGLFPPRDVPLLGDLLGWVVREQLPIRSEAPPLWAEDDVTAAGLAPIPIRHGYAVLSAEFAHARELPETADLERAAAYLAAFIDLEHERRASVEHRTRLEALMQALRRLPAEIEPAALAEQLAGSAIELTDARGACVIEWNGNSGRVLAVRGNHAIEAGTPVVAQESESALAAKSGAAIVRHGRKRNSIVAANEQFPQQPRAFAAIPLIVGTDVIGVVTVWTGEDILDPEGVSSLEALTPFAALQFRHAQAYGQLRQRAEHDRLTGLLNRQAFDHEIDGEAARFDRYQRPYSLLMLDLDHFKQVNDRYGHQVGDAVLAHVGETLAKTLREVDIAARYGGEEFAVILPETDLRTAEEIAERIRVAIAGTPASTSAGKLPITVSIGASSCPERAGDPATLIRTADAALYQSKRAGRNRVTAAN